MSGPPAFLRCRLPAGFVALPAAGVVGLEGVERLQRNPRPGPLSGWLLGADYESPVYDLSVLLGCAPLRTGSEAQVVLYGDPAAPRGLLVEAVDRLRPEATTLLARPRLFDRHDLRSWAGVIAVEGSLVPCLDPSRLHSDLEPCGAFQGPVSVPREPLPPPPAASAPALLTFEAGEGSGERGPEPGFALSVSQVVEVVEVGPPAPLPGAPGFLLGLIEWRGRALALVDLAVALGRKPHGPAAPRRALIARTLDPTDCIALAACGEIEMRRLPLQGRLVAVPDGTAPPVPGAILGCAEIGGRTFFLPDLERILAWQADGGPSDFEFWRASLEPGQGENHAADAAQL